MPSSTVRGHLLENRSYSWSSSMNREKWILEAELSLLVSANSAENEKMLLMVFSPDKMMIFNCFLPLWRGQREDLKRNCFIFYTPLISSARLRIFQLQRHCRGILWAVSTEWLKKVSWRGGFPSVTIIPVSTGALRQEKGKTLLMSRDRHNSETMKLWY